MAKELVGWLRFGIALLVVIVGAALFVFRAQASQDLAIQHNQSRVEAVEKTINGSLEKLNDNIVTLSAKVSEIKSATVRIETIQTAQGDDILELKGVVEKLRNRGTNP